MRSFIGKQKQIPPIYSAVKREGKKLYKYARKGIKIERGFFEIKIYDIKVLDYKFPILKIKIRCSSGTYIRSLAHDISQKIGCGTYLQELQRTKIGNFNIKKSIEINKLNSDNWRGGLL